MKKYSEYLNNKHSPLTGEELNEIVKEVAKDKWYEADDNTLEDMFHRVLGEVVHLRALLAESYNWIGRGAPSKMTRKYMELMRESHRIKKELDGQ